MSDRITQTLDLLLGLPQAEIDTALAAAPADLEKIIGQMQDFYSQPMEKKTPEATALNLHHRLLEAAALRARPDIPEDLRLFVASSAATQIAEDGSAAAFGSGRLSEIAEALSAIELREGLAKNETYLIDEGPADHQELIEESDAICEAITERLFVHFLRHYRYHDFADLYENERVVWAVRNEVGRRLSRPGGRERSEVDERIEQMLIDQYGRKAWDLLLARLKVNGLADGS